MEDESLQDKLDYIDEGNNSETESIVNNGVGLNFAKKEAKSYEEQRADVYGQQGIQLERTFFTIASIFIWVLSILLIILILIWFFHLVSPPCWKWLTNENVQSIERILFASTILSLAGKYFSKYKVLEKL